MADNRIRYSGRLPVETYQKLKNNFSENQNKINMQNMVTFLQFNESPNKRKRILHGYSFSIYKNGNAMTVTFSSDMSQLLKGLGYQFMRIGVNELENAMYFVFGSAGDIPLAGFLSAQNQSVQLNRIEPAKAIAKHLGHKEDEYWVVKLVRLGDTANFKVGDVESRTDRNGIGK